MSSTRLVFVLVTSFAQLAAAQAASRKAPDVGLVLCRETKDSKASPWERNALLSVGRALFISDAVKSVGARYQPCDEVLTDDVCFAVPKALVCRSSVIERLLKASAWMTAVYAQAGKPHYEDFRILHRRAVLDAFDYADGAPSDPNIDKLVEAIRAAEAKPEKPASTQPPDSEIETLTALYQHIVDMNLAALLGHESSHLFNDNCPITQPSISEQSGFFDKLLDIQLKGSLFCQRNPVLIEVKADRCALRYLHALDQRETSKAVAGTEDLSSFSRRAAADVLTFQSLTGWRRPKDVPYGKMVLIVRKQYLYEPFRALLMTTEIHGDRSGTPTCGESASLVVHGVQEAVKACGKDAGGIVPDEVLAKFPRGVEESWNGKPWTDASYRCQ
jgi:hypothetical protein